MLDQSHQAPQQAPQQVVVVQKRGGCLRNILILVGLVIVIGIIAAVATPKNGATGSTTGSTGANNQGNNAQPATTVPAGPAPSYSEIAAQKAALTAAQWDEYAKSLKGLRVDNWSGTVLNVDNKPLSDNYLVMIDLDGKGGSMNVAEAQIEVSKAEALKIEKGRKITFSGTVKGVNCVLTYCPVEVENATYSVE